MKLFFYKSLTILVFFLIAVHFSFGILKKKIQNEIQNFSSKENVEKIKNKIREELGNSSKKENIINSKDAELINSFIKKIKKDLNNK